MKQTKKLRISYAQTVYGDEERKAVEKVLKNPFKITPGEQVKRFEEKIAALFGKKYGIMVNSGSSANLLAVELLDLPAGSEVITPILTFGTTVAPLIQKGLVPVFIDAMPGTYLINIDEIEKALTPKTRALMVPSLLGNIPDMARLQKIAKKHNLFFIEDSCDTLGATFAGKPTGFYSDISTTSFYASHIITTAGAGGMICVNNPEFARRALVLGSWGRSSTLFGFHEKSEDIKKRFDNILDGDAYDAKFIFSEMGYNFQTTELNAAFGLEQLKRLSKFAKIRKENFTRLRKFFEKYEQFFILPERDNRAEASWLAFPLTIKKGAPFTRLEITKYLEEENVQTRPIFTGNILKHPAFAKITRYKKEKAGYPVTDHIMKNGFLIGCHHGMTKEQLATLEKIFTRFLEKF